MIKLTELTPSRIKYKKGDIVTITNGPWKGEKAKLKSTYHDQYGGSNKQDWTVYIYSIQDEVSWIRPAEMKPYKG